MTLRRIGLAVGAAVALLGLSATMSVTAANADNIRLQSTTDIRDAGVFDDVVRQGYLDAQPGDTLNFTVGSTVYPQFVGTGAALTAAQLGYADVVVTHAPSSEKLFVNNGYSLGATSGSTIGTVGNAIFYNDYVIVGPTADPAGVFSSHPHDAVAAFQDIAATGATGHATFVTRGDASGTNVQEQILWGLTTGVTKQGATNAPVGDTTRFEPGSGGTYPTWYKRTGQGQAANLATTNTCNTGTFPNGSCYTMLDSGTWLHQIGVSGNLKKVSDHNSAGAIGGQDLQTNYFHAYVLNPNRSYSSGVTPNVAAAQRFVDYLVSAQAQNDFSQYPASGIGNAAVNPDAYPEYTWSVPSNPARHSSISISVTAKYAAPPKPVLSSLSLQLQKSLTNGASWSNVTTASTNGSGVATFGSVTIDCNTNYRVTMTSYDNSTYPSIFSRFAANQSGPQPITTSPSSAPSGGACPP